MEEVKTPSPPPPPPPKNNNKRLMMGISIGVLIGVIAMTVFHPFTSDQLESTRIQVVKVLDNAYLIQSMIATDIRNNFINFTTDHWNDSIIVDYLQHFQLPEWDPTRKDTILDVIRPGLKFKGKKLGNPVVLIPGFITTRLEYWDGDMCGDDFFRSSIWGDLSMIHLLISNASCWIKHLSLDPETGMDPPGIKIRPTEGFHGIDYLFPTFWVWAKLIRNLADIGYEPSDFYAASYDWRMSPQNLEKRDSYFTRLSIVIESMVKRTNKKVVVISHSMGSNVFFFFLKWTETHVSADWADKHIDGWVNIGSPFLGSVKGVSCLLSGEMKDTAEMEKVRAYVADRVVSPLERLNLFRSWSSVAFLLPKGGNAMWGDENGAPDDPPPHSGGLEEKLDMSTKTPVYFPSDGSYKHIITFSDGIHKNLTVDEALPFLWETMTLDKQSDKVQKNMRNWYSFGLANEKTGFKYKWDNTSQESKHWTNPLESPLPYAPNMKIYCFYGVGKDTERGYVYRDQEIDKRSPLLTGLQYSMDTSKEVFGVRQGMGDGTVPLLSLGYMCVEGWKNSFYNPGLAPVITREHVHNPSSVLSDPRGGQFTSDHVDIMGNYRMMADIVSILTGTEIQDDIFSPIITMSKSVTERIKNMETK